MNRELIETVESLGGTALMGGILIQFSDTAFEQALKKIYEVGVEAEREECAGLCDRFANRMMSAEECADAIRARGQT